MAVVRDALVRECYWFRMVIENVDLKTQHSFISSIKNIHMDCISANKRTSGYQYVMILPSGAMFFIYSVEILLKQ